MLRVSLAPEICQLFHFKSEQYVVYLTQALMEKHCVHFDSPAL
jgi:hypothetical protein